MSELEEILGGILNNPSQMQTIMEAAGSLLGTGMTAQSSEEDVPEGASADKPKLPAEIGSVLQNFMKNGKEAGGNKTALFAAIKPYLSEKRGEKLDKAVKLVAALRVARIFFKKTGSELL